MATPIETNTEDLREILQAVYDLKNSAGGGSSEPDLVIRGTDLFYMWSTNAKEVTYNPDEVISVYEKVKAGEDVKVILTAQTGLTSWNPDFSITLHASMVASSNYGTEPEQLMVYFNADGNYFPDDYGTICYIKYIFDIDRVNSTAVLNKTISRSIVHNT